MKIIKKINWKKVCRVCNIISVPLQALGCCILYFIIEAISRHSLNEAWTFMTGRPWVFLYNAFLIFTTSVVVYLFRRRALVRIIVGAFWLFLGIVNGVILASRVTPFTGPDLKLLSDATKIMNNYMSPVTLIAAGAGIVAFFGFLIWFGIRGPKFQGKLRWFINLPCVLLTVALCVGATYLALDKRILSNYFGNIAFAYQDYGYPYCLGVTIFDTGISEPNGYSKEMIDEIVASEGEIKETNLEKKPNIIFLQLESFFDPELVNFLNISEDPIPNFRQLMKEYSSGYYRVPSIGAGTANTEFESITGMSLRYFGAGEYPYKTVLKEETCESAPFVLKNLGYSTHAIHNNEANFYSRKSVYPMLGFDTFTSEEYMPDITDTTETGWVKDHYLTGEIMKCLESSDEPDYVYTVSVQGHGDYPTEPVLEDPQITVTGAENKEKNNYSWEYYVNEIHEMDEFVKELTDTLSTYDEPVVLVMYGDHLPTMGLETEDLENRYLFQTQYVMWDNMGLEKKDKNLSAYQMAAEVFNRVGIHEGTLMNYHQTRKNTKNYQVDLEMIQYDLLYGSQYLYDGENPFEKTTMQLGVLPVTIDTIRRASLNTVSVTGTNFTASSKIEINGELQENTVYLSTTSLLLQDATLADGDTVDIAQQSNSSTKRVLSRSAAIVYHDPDISTYDLTTTPGSLITSTPAADAAATPAADATTTPAADGTTTPDTTAAATPTATVTATPAAAPKTE